MKIKIISLLILLTWIGIGFGCGKKEETQDPQFIRCLEAKENKQIEAATKGFYEYLEKHPKSWRAYRHLGDLFFENSDRPEFAIYLYEKCLELGPDQDEAGLIRDWVNSSREKLYRQLQKEHRGEEASYEQLKKTLVQLQEVSYKQNEYIKKQQERLEEFQKLVSTHNLVPPSNPLQAEQPTELSLTERRRQALAERLRLNRNETLQETSSQQSTETPLESNNQYNIYTVKSGDTLSKIALQFYGNKNKYHIIIKANPEIFSNGKTSLSIGMKIKVPKE